MGVFNTIPPCFRSAPQWTCPNTLSKPRSTEATACTPTRLEATSTPQHCPKRTCTWTSSNNAHILWTSVRCIARHLLLLWLVSVPLWTLLRHYHRAHPRSPQIWLQKRRTGQKVARLRDQILPLLFHTIKAPRAFWCRNTLDSTPREAKAVQSSGGRWQLSSDPRRN